MKSSDFELKQFLSYCNSLLIDRWLIEALPRVCIDQWSRTRAEAVWVQSLRPVWSRWKVEPTVALCFCRRRTTFDVTRTQTRLFCWQRLFLRTYSSAWIWFWPVWTDDCKVEVNLWPALHQTRYTQLHISVTMVTAHNKDGRRPKERNLLDINETKYQETDSKIWIINQSDQYNQFNIQVFWL